MGSVVIAAVDLFLVVFYKVENISTIIFISGNEDKLSINSAKVEKIEIIIYYMCDGSIPE